MKIVLQIVALCIGLSSIAFSDLTSLCKDASQEELKELVRTHMLDIHQKKILDINQDGINEQVVLHDNIGSKVRLDELDIYTVKDKRINYEGYEPAAFTQTRELFTYEGKYYVAHYYDVKKEILQYITYFDSQMREKALCTLPVEESHKTEFRTVFQKPIALDSQTQATLTLQEEKTEQELLEEPAKILIDYESNGTKKQYIFTDKEKKFPLLYFDGLTLNTKIDKRVNLIGSVNCFDSDGNGNNEIFVYGTSHYGGSGLVGKVAVFHKNTKGEIEALGMVEGRDNFEINYIKKENIIVLAQYIWQLGVEGHYGDSHHYQLSVYELEDHLKEIPLFTTQKKYNDRNSSVIKDTLESVLAHYNQHKK